MNKIIQGDCIEELRKLEENSVDSIITDPPYGLEFMGKEWDKFKEGKNIAGGQAGAGTPFMRSKPLNSVYQYGLEEKNQLQKFCQSWATQCLRVLKPGGYLLSFGGTRTYHRMTCGIEDAGFEIRDTIMWLYGSGFPKSLNIGKQIDKINGKYNEDFTKFGNYIKECREKKGLSRNEVEKELGTNTALAWWEGRNYLGKFIVQLPDKKHYEELKKLLQMDNRFDKLVDWQEAEREVIGKHQQPAKEIYQGGELSKDLDITLQSTPEAKQWEGWGTALKPACEPIVVARKPLSEKNVALNVLKWGTGGLNIDEGRIGTNKTDKNWRKNPSVRNKETEKHLYGDYNEHNTHNLKEQGRFPANIILDEEAGRMLDEQAPETGAFAPVKSGQKGFGGTIYGKYKSGGDDGKTFHNEKLQGASRFFYCAKASKSERNFGCKDLPEVKKYKEDNSAQSHEIFSKNMLRLNPKTGELEHEGITKNNHPTVKPIKLMEYLIKLVSKENTIVLDPFIGSGTTAIACLKLNRQFIGIEKEEEYIKIAKARIKPYLEQTKLK